MTEISRRLKQERLRLGLSLEQVAEKTGITRGLLQRLEAGNYTEIGNHHLIQGIINAYCRALEIDPQCSLEQTSNANAQAATQQLADTSSKLKHWRFLALLLLTVGVLAALITVAWLQGLIPGKHSRNASGHLPFEREIHSGMGGFLRNTIENTRAAMETQASLQKNHKPMPSLAEKQTDQNTKVEESISNHSGRDEEQKSKTTEPTNAKAEHPARPASTSAMEKERRMLEARRDQLLLHQSTPAAGQAFYTNEPYQANNPDTLDHTLEIQATDDCWIELIIDELITEKYLLKSGEHRTWKANKNVRLILGNAGGVRISWDGRWLDPVGKSGKVVRLNLPAAK